MALRFYYLTNTILFIQKTLAFNEKELCKFFKPGDHVKVVSGVQEGATGMVVKVEGHVLIILSDTTKEHVGNPTF
jgi:transcription elongation factor SPT5